MDLSTKRILVVGAGNMGGALLLGLKGLRTRSLSFYDIDPKKASAFSRKSGIKPAPSLPAAIPRVHIVILAIKPQGLPQFLKAARACFRDGQVLITIMAGIRIRTLARALPARLCFVRAMPNTPALVGQGFTAVACKNRAARLAAKKIFGRIGSVVLVRESMLDAVTALSGAGPAYVYAFIESFAAAARKSGFPKDKALALVQKTLEGALKLLSETRETPGALRQKVTSPGGVTEAALKTMARLGFAQILSKGVSAGIARARELGA